MNNRSIVLLSGGLDSLVSLAYIKEKTSDVLALTFNYGQKSFISEKNASEKIANYYSVDHKIINLDWLAEISTSSLNTNEDIPKLSISDLDDNFVSESSAKSVWVPNRNALFINIAATFADALDYSEIVIGANKEEAATFKDNSVEFIDAMNLSLKNSTNSSIYLSAPLINMSKKDIISNALKLCVPLELLHSCYLYNDKHCGYCESCLRLKRALIENNCESILKKIFK